MSCHRIIMKGGHKVCLPVTNREEYLKLRGSKVNIGNRIMASMGNEDAKRNLVQMNYSCLPNDDGTLKGSTRMSTTIGMDVDHIPTTSLEQIKQLILEKKDELGLLMLELSARGEGFHLVFRRKPGLSQEDNLRWASNLLGVEYDKGAKDITRVFYTTSASPEDLIYLSNSLFEIEEVEGVKEGVKGGVKMEVKGDDTTNAPALADLQSDRTEYKHLQCDKQNVGIKNPYTQSSRISNPSEQVGASFRGIPYALIVNGLLDLFGFHDGFVPEGVRNTTLYKLARQMRYICDFNAIQLRSVLPDWGLPESEVLQTISSAISSTRSQNFPPELKRVLDDIQKPDLSTTAKRQAYLERLNPLPERMPWLLKYIYRRYGRHGRTALVTALPMLGTLLGRFESKYLDGRKHRPVFMVVVCGHAGSGKGFIADLQEWLLKPVLEDDERGRAELEAYNKEKEKKKGAKQLPDKPTPCMRVLSATSSNGMLLERAKASLGQPLCVITEEIDESARANKNGAWADKSDIYRKAFDGALWGQDYLTYSGSVHIFVNLIFAGTYVSVRNYFQNVENGLMTRFFFTEMTRDLGQNVEVRKDIETNDDREAARIVRNLYQQGCTLDIPEPENIIAFALKKGKQDAYEFNEEKIQEWEASGPDEDHRDTAIDLLRRRAAVVLFRASQVMYALEGNRETSIGRAMARWYANESYLNQYIMFADAINESAKANEAIQRKQDIAASRVAKNDALFRLLAKLPEEFSLTDVQNVMEANGLKPKGATQYIARMLQRELIMSLAEGYKKLDIS